MNQKVQNKVARHNYEIIDSFEVGIVLLGDEIKALRIGRVNLQGSYAKIFYRNGKPEVFLVGAHFASNTHDPYRTRKLLLHKKEIQRLIGKTVEQGLTLVPLSAYLTRGVGKIELALGKGKKLYDKRESIKKRDIDKRISKNFGL